MALANRIKIAHAQEHRRFYKIAIETTMSSSRKHGYLWNKYFKDNDEKCTSTFEIELGL